jgi:hypothetical protein
MTWSAQFEVTEVDGLKAVAKASTQPGSTDSHEVGTLIQNTEHAVRMELHVEFEEGTEVTLQVGDKISGQGHFNA